MNDFDLAAGEHYRLDMASRLSFWILLVALIALLPFRSPAPLVYIPGEGWYYESYGETLSWQRSRAKDQLEVAEVAFKEAW